MSADQYTSVTQRRGPKAREQFRNGLFLKFAQLDRSIPAFQAWLLSNPEIQVLQLALLHVQEVST